jgi:inorganic pyrophosphatase
VLARALGVDSPFDRIPSFAAGGRNLNVIVETPRGSGWKFAFDTESGLFGVSGYLPAGLSFPFEFGFVPGTLADDGDPLDVLLLVDSPTFTGCRLEARPIGVIEAKQAEEGRTFRNDRLVAVPAESRAHEKIRRLDDVGARLLDEIETFFATYDAANDKQFKPLARRGPRVAHQLVLQAQARARQKRDEEGSPRGSRKARSAR